MREKLLLQLQYLGRGYCGWQSQHNIKQHPKARIDQQDEHAEASVGKNDDDHALVDVSVSDAFTAALQANGLSGGLVAAGRTDRGVHAMHTLATLTVRDGNWPYAAKDHSGLNLPANAVDCLRPSDSRSRQLAALRDQLNACLPVDVRLLRIDDSHRKAHAMTGCGPKTYTYYVCDAAPATMRAWDGFCWIVDGRLDLQAMQRAAAALTGHNDFKQLSSVPRSSTRNTVRSVQISVRRLAHIHFPLLGCFSSSSPDAPVAEGDCAICALTAKCQTGFTRATSPRPMSAAVSATSGHVADVSSDVNLNADADADCHDGAGAGPIAHEATPVTPAVDLEARAGAEVAAESESTSLAEGAHTLKKSAADADVEAKFCSETGIDAQGVTMIELRFYGSGFLRHQVRRTTGLLVRIGSGMEPETVALEAIGKCSRGVATDDEGKAYSGPDNDARAGPIESETWDREKSRVSSKPSATQLLAVSESNAAMEACIGSDKSAHFPAMTAPSFDRSRAPRAPPGGLWLQTVELGTLLN